MFELMLATANTHKLTEFKDLLAKSQLKISQAPTSIEVEESGEDYRANALLKAKAYYNKFATPSLSDDSGLEIKGLPGELGVHTARFGGEGLSSVQRCELVLERMKNLDTEKRAAEFICILCAYLSEREVYFFEGRTRGAIATELRGSEGFGYDPIFIPEGQDASFAQLPQFKEKNSHRAFACNAMSSFFAKRVCQNS